MGVWNVLFSGRWISQTLVCFNICHSWRVLSADYAIWMFYFLEDFQHIFPQYNLDWACCVSDKNFLFPKLPLTLRIKIFYTRNLQCTTCAVREISCSEASFSREEMFSVSPDALNAIGRNPILYLSTGVIFVNLLKMMSWPSPHL